MARPYRDMEERLIANSVVDYSTGCWLWLGHIINPNHLQVIPAYENLSYRNGRRP